MPEHQKRKPGMFLLHNLESLVQNLIHFDVTGTSVTSQGLTSVQALTLHHE